MIPGSANPLLLASAAEAGAYAIERSVRFNSADSAYLSRTPSSAGNRTTWTWAGWVKRSAIAFSAEQHIWGVTGTTDATYGEMFFGTGDTLRFAVGYNTAYGITTTRVFRDASAWYHIVLAFDATQGTAANKIKLYINGVEETTFSSDNRSSLANQDWGYNNNVAHYIGRQANSNIRHFNGYLADIHFIDGQALDPTSFGEFSATTGVWVPKAYTGSFGTNGFHLPFDDNSTAAALGYDAAGSNDWTVNNISVTAGAGNDSLVDVPTNGSETDTGVGGEVRGNYATWSPLDVKTTIALSNGNLDLVGSSDGRTRGTISMPTGKWYWEITATAVPTSDSNHVCIWANNVALSNDTYRVIYRSDGAYVVGGTLSTGWASWTTNDVIGVTFDADTRETKFYKNNTLQGTVTAPALPSGSAYTPAVILAGTNSGQTANFGQRPFAYTAPSGFKALNTANLPAPVITKPSEVMNTVLYSGTGSSQSISGVGFGPDWVWIKRRNADRSHMIFDIVRGLPGRLASNETSTENTDINNLTSFDSDGFTASTGDAVNGSGGTYVAWCWDAGSSTVSNTQGSITSSVRANASAGFSICTLTTQSSGTGTFGHGLNVAPQLVITKARAVSNNWITYHASVGNTGALLLNSTAATDTQSFYWNNTSPTSSVVTLGSGFGGSNSLVCYCFAPVAGYSSFGSYTGNGSATDNTFVYTGMRPRFVLLKRSDSTGNWVIWDAVRNSYNVANSIILPNSSAAEYSPDAKIDILSNGFKVRDNSSDSGTNGATYIYAAFSEVAFNFARAR